MKILNTYINNTNTPKLKKNNAAALYSVNFGSKKLPLVNTFTLKESQQKVLKNILDNYNKVFEKFRTYPSVTATNFKELYPGIMGKSRIKGFLFKDMLSDERGINIIRYIHSKTQALSFNIYDKDSQLLERFMIEQSGNIQHSINNNKTRTEDSFVSTTLFQTILDKMDTAMSDLALYSEYYKQVAQKFKKGASKQEIFDFIQQLAAVKNSVGIKSLVDDTYSANQSLEKLLYKYQGNGMFQLKKKYLNYTEEDMRVKGLIFRNIPKDGNTLIFCPLNSANDDRKFKVFVYGKDMSLKKGFVTFGDGKVAELKDLDKPRTLQSYNLKVLNDDEIKQSGIIDYCQYLQQEFKNFESFIKHERVQESKQKLQEKVVQLPEKKSKAVDIKPSKEKRISKIKHSSKTKTSNKPKRVKKNVPVIKKVVEQVNKLSNIVKSVVSKSVHEDFINLNLTKLTKSLNDLFDTPVEKRSPHLIHEKMKTGQIFSGRIHLNSDDGTKLTISRVKSPKYVEFTYYSVKMEKDGKTVIVNIDPQNSRIIETAPDGKPVIHNKVKIKYISRQEAAEKFPQLSSLPKYLSEVFEMRDGMKRTYINSNLKTKVVKSQDEMDKSVMDILNQIGTSERDYF